MEDILFYQEQKYQIINNLQELDSFFSQKKCDQVQSLTITLEKENLKKFLHLQQLPILMPTLKEIYFDLSQNALNNMFLNELMDCLNNLKYLYSANIKLIQNRFTYKQSKKFIIYIQKRFQIKGDIECSYINKQISLVCGKTSISFNQDFKKSILIKEGLNKSMKIVIPKAQYEFKTYIIQSLKQEIENLQVIIYYNNQKIAVCQSNYNCQLLINLHFEDQIDLQNYIYSHHDIVHISINSNKILFLNLSQFDKYYHVNLELSNDEFDILLFQDLKYTKNKQIFIQKQIPDERFAQLSQIYFKNNYDVQFAKQYILPKLLFVEGKLIQNTISFYFEHEKESQNNIFAKFDTLGEINLNEKKTNFIFFDIEAMINVFNAIFSILQNSQLVLHELNLYHYHGIQIDQQNKQFFLKMVDKDIEYNIKQLNIQDQNQQLNLFHLIIPILEEVISLEEIYIQVYISNYTYENFFDDNIKYLQRNKSKSLYHLILDFDIQYVTYYYDHQIQKNQKLYSIDNVYTISVRQSNNPLQFFNISKCKRLLFFNQIQKRITINRKIVNYRENILDFDTCYCSCCSDSFYDSVYNSPQNQKEEIHDYTDLTYFYN